MLAMYNTKMVRRNTLALIAAFVTLIISEGCQTRAIEKFPAKHYIAPMEIFARHITFALLPYSKIHWGSEINSAEEIKILFELRNCLEQRGYEEVKEGNIPDFIATVTTDPIDNTVWNDTLPLIQDNISLFDSNSTKSLIYNEFWVNGEILNKIFATTTKQKGWESYSHPKPVTVLFFDTQSKTNIYRGITKSDAYTSDPNIFRQELLKRLLSNSLPSTNKFDYFFDNKKGMVGMAIDIYSKDEQPYYPEVMDIPPKGSPAAKAGFQFKDQIIGVDNISTANRTYLEIVSMIRGAVGEPVKIDFLRRGRHMQFTLTRVSGKSLNLR